MNLFTASALAALFVFSSCSPNRTQWMAQAATDQATVATEDMGKPDQVRLGAKAEATLLNEVATATSRPLVRRRGRPPS